MTLTNNDTILNKYLTKIVSNSYYTQVMSEHDDLNITTVEMKE